MASIMRGDEAATGAHRRVHRQAVAAPLATFTLSDHGNADSLSSLIEREVIPRLMIAHAAELPERATAVVDRTDVEALAMLALQSEAGALLAHVDAIVARDVAADVILVELLAPAARLLGEYWESDRCDFLDVTMALWRLQEVVHELAGRLPAERLPGSGASRALFATMPGDHHSFGTVVIDELFRREGWLTDRMSEATTAELLRRVSEDWWDLIGLTVTCDCHIAPLGSVIGALRNVSRNPRVCVMVGGRVFAGDPELAREVGADGTAGDAKLALERASGLVLARKREALALG